MNVIVSILIIVLFLSLIFNLLIWDIRSFLKMRKELRNEKNPFPFD